MENDTDVLDGEDGIIPALIRAQGEMDHAQLDGTGNFENKYASLKSVIDAVKAPLNNNGIVFSQRSEKAKGGVSVTTILTHVSGESLSSGPVFVPADKLNAWGYGSALTYGKRYSLAMVCGISADVDDDAQGAVHDLIEYNQHVRDHFETVAEVKTQIAVGLLADPDDQRRHDAWSAASEAWNELSNNQKQSLWIAPSKGGIFTTLERKVMKEELPKYLERTYER